MSWDLVKAIQDETDVRLILPFGLNLRVGDVVSVATDGNFTLQGSAKTLLGVPAGKPRDAGKAADVYRLVGQDATCEFRAAGDASSLFPDLPKASAKVDVSFHTARSWLLAVSGRRLSSLDELNRFRQPILDAYRRNVWRPDWALITSIADAGAMTLLASRSANTNVALTLSGQVAAGASMEAKLTAGAAIAATSEEITQCIFGEPAPVACSALRVKDPWWRGPDVTDLERAAPEGSPGDAEDDEFWEPVDEGAH